MSSQKPADAQHALIVDDNLDLADGIAELYRGVVDTVDAFIVGLAHDGAVRVCNRRAEQALGLADQGLLGRPLGEMLATDHARVRLTEVLREVQQGGAVSDIELPLQARDGGQRIVRWRLRRIEPFQGSSELILAVGEDLTDRVELERRAAEAEAMASLSTLTTGLAHEIRNPLNAAALQLELLRRAAGKQEEEALRKTVATRVAFVSEELSRLSDLLDDFLSLAKPRALSRSPVELCDLVRDVLASYESLASGAGIALYVQPSSDEVSHMRALADEPLLRQLLSNLIANSIEAMRERGHGAITVHCHALGDRRIELSVEDDGPGIPREVQDKVLSPFVTTKRAGTGLGLTIVKRIVDRHGGTLVVRSARGRGTTVRVTLERA